MRLYNNDPAIPGSTEGYKYTELAVFFSQLKERKFFLRDLYTFGCPRLGGVMEGKDWAGQYENARLNHTGQSWRMVNKYDPVTAVPPVIPWISTWNHVDNGYQVSDDGSPQALPSEVGTQPGISIKPWNFPYHCEIAHLSPDTCPTTELTFVPLSATEKYFANLYNASVAGLQGDEAKPYIVKWVEEVPPEEVWKKMEAEAQALFAD